jgi:transcriptional regulator of arginine metabolism
MVAKSDRWDVIRRLVQNEAVGTQDDIRRALRREGLAVDQSTLSRDLVELGIRKAAGRYVIERTKPAADAEVDYSAVVESFMTCGPHQIIVRTAIGQAQPVAVAIDEKREPAIAATLAGDDTILVLTKNRRSQVVALRRLEQWFGDKHER